MLRGIFNVVPVGRGIYGPFPDAIKAREETLKRPLTADEKAELPTYPWVAFGAADGEGEPIRATLAEGVAFDAPLYQQTPVDLEVRQDGGKLKLRCYGAADQKKLREAV